MVLRVLIEFCCKICIPYQNRSPKIVKKKEQACPKNDWNSTIIWMITMKFDNDQTTRIKKKWKKSPTIYWLGNQNQIWLWIPISWSNLVVMIGFDQDH